MLLSDRKVFLSVRFGGKKAAELRRLVTDVDGVLVKLVAAADVTVFPDLDDVHDPDLPRVAGDVLKTTGEVLKECVDNEWELPRGGVLRSNCLRDCSVTTTGLSRVLQQLVAVKAEALGAQFGRAFNQRTTHLITEVAGSEKHRAALRTSKFVISKDWLEACWSSLRKAPEKDFPIAALQGLVVSATGLSLRARSQAAKQCKELGAKFVTNLTSQTTHLVAGAAFGRKFEYAVQHGVRVVSPKWLNENLRRGHLVEEGAFAVSRSPTEQASSSLLDGCCVFLEDVTAEEERYLSRILRATGATRLPRLNQMTTHVVAGSNFSRNQHPRELLRDTLKQGAVLVNPQWADACLRAGSVAEADDFAVELAMPKGSPEAPNFAHVKRIAAEDTTIENSTVFRGLRIGSSSDDASRLVVKGGGKVIQCNAEGAALDGVPTHVVVEHGTPAGEASVARVTRKWLGACLRANSLLPVGDNRLYEPILHKIPLPAMQGYNITVSGFYSKVSDGQPLRSSISELIALLGAKFSERMERKATTHLVCESPSGAKYGRAQEWNIPCVSSAWLFRCADTGTVPDTHGFPVPHDVLVPDRSADTSTADGDLGKSQATTASVDRKRSAKLLMSLAEKYSEKKVQGATRKVMRAAAMPVRPEADRAKTVKLSELESEGRNEDDEDTNAPLSQAQVVTYCRPTKKRLRSESTLDEPVHVSAADNQLTQESSY